jgi:hypothetical protein
LTPFILKTQMPSRAELAIAFKSKIEANQSKSIELDQEIRRIVLEKLNVTRAQGIILEDARSALDEEAFAGVTAGIDADAVRSYIRFAKKNREPIEDFTVGIRTAFEEALRTSGALPTSDGLGAQISHDPPGFFQWSARFVMEFKQRFAKYLSAKPLERWDAYQAEQFLYSLRPVLKVHKQVSEWLRTQ